MSTVRASQPQALIDAAGEMGGKIDALQAVIDGERTQLERLQNAWEGDAAAAAVAKGRQLIAEQEKFRARLVQMQTALRDGGEQLDALRSAIVTMADTLAAMGFSVADDGTVTPHQWLVGRFLDGLAEKFTGFLKHLLETFDSVDASTAAAIEQAAAAPTPGASVKVGGQDIQLPAPGTDAAEVEKWWNSLSHEQRDGLRAAHPAGLGNLNGIPIVDRDQVNQKVMEDDLKRVRDIAGRSGVSEDDVVKNPEKYGLTQVDATRFYNARRTGEGLAHQRGGDPKAPRPVMLMAYDPLADNGQGRAAITIGNPDTARNTAVIVPGTGSSVRDGWLADGHDDAINMYEQSRLADRNNDTAVVMWMGYDAPDSFTDPRIANPDLARRGGALLAADVNALGVTHDPSKPSHVTVIGHSYGSTTVADAFAGSGMKANDAVLIGCPGTDLAKSAADFHVDGGQVYVGSASTDPVSWLGNPGAIPANVLNEMLGYPVGAQAGLGTDPAGDEYGSVRFRAEVAGEDGVSFHDHSRYYEKGSEALRAMTDIASGHSERLTSDGLLAEGRHQPHISTPDHVDVPGIGSIPLPHIDTDIPGVPAFIDPEADRPGSSVTLDHGYKPTN